MPDSPLIARIRLARSPARLYGLPLLLVLVAVGLVAAALLAPLGLAEPWRLAIGAGAAILVAAGAILAIRPATLRLDVEEAAVRIHWLGGERRYVLAPGPVTRVRLRGENASSLRPHRRWRTWQLGAARLRDEEEIEVVRLAATPTVILVPTERGRLAIAAASEDELIDALSHAARARQEAEKRESAAAEPEPALSEPEPEPRPLTGIERALLEERLAREREAGGAAAPVAPAAPAPTEGPAGVISPTDVPEEARPSAPEPATVSGRRRLGRPRPSAALVLLPLIGAGAVWGLAGALGRLPEPASDIGRLAALGLVLAGPATSIGAIMARAWWPRLVGVVVTSGLAASVFVGRALLGA